MTPNKEDYLKCIHELGLKEEKISNKMIAEKMQFSAPAVSEMMKKLIAEQLISKDSKLGYTLSQTGLDMVADLYRKHRLIEVFLINHLGYSAKEIHEEAEVLEHTVSDNFINRLEKFLDFPAICPHGGTIPAQGQPLVEQYQTSLDTITESDTYQLVRVHDHFQLLHYLETHGLAISDTFQVNQIDHFAQTITISLDGKELAVPLSIAKQLYVEKPEV
ncbi:metal-dependent transcriptional regulator [Streptococcus cameli]